MPEPFFERKHLSACSQAKMAVPDKPKKVKAMLVVERWLRRASDHRTLAQALIEAGARPS